jgi:nicotinamidase-related amidase/CDGSH-type Zn-finger protein
MSGAKTLLQMAGANPQPAKLADAALIIIDAQNEYVSGKLPLDGINAALGNIALLLKAARATRAPVIHIVQRGRPGGIFDPAGEGFRIAPQAAPIAGEMVIEKSLPNSFAKTDLHAAVQATDRKSLVIAGFMTHMCVSATARSALDHGYGTTVVADAVATRALPDPLGGADIPSSQLHRTALAELADRFAAVACVADLGVRYERGAEFMRAIPDIGGRKPIAIEVEAGKSYWWCACGRSKAQPFCDGSHKGTEFAPQEWKAPETATVKFCACKRSSHQPLCDGSHKALPQETL